MHGYIFLLQTVWWLFTHTVPVACHSTNSLLLVISLDGFRWDSLEMTKSRQLPTPNFDRFITEGGKAEYLKPIYPSKTDPTHYSMATGLHAESHGLVQNKFWDPLYKEYFDFDNLDVKTETKWYDNDGKVEPLWITNQRGGQTIFPRRSGVVFWPGGTASFGDDHMYPEHFIQEGTARNDTEFIITVVSWFATEDKPINFAMVHLAGTDHIGHRHGPESEEVMAEIQVIDKQLELLFSELEKHHLQHHVNIVLLGDHGMVEITKTIGLDDYLDPSLYTAYGYSPMWQIVPKEGKDEEVREALQKLADNNTEVSLYLDQKTPEEYHFSKHRRVLPIILRVDEGILLAHNASKKIAGDHGYPDSPSMRAFLAVHGPAFVAGSLCGPVSQVDIYPLMCHILDIKPGHPHNGSLEPLMPLLASHETEDITAYITLITFVTSVGFAATVSGVFCVAACRVYRYSRYRSRRIVLRRPEIQLNDGVTEANKSLLMSDDDEEL